MRMALCLWALLCLAAQKGYARPTLSMTEPPYPAFANPAFVYPGFANPAFAYPGFAHLGFAHPDFAHPAFVAFADTVQPAPVSGRTLSSIGSRLQRLNVSITRNTTRYLKEMSNGEQALRNRIASTDSNAAVGLFAHASGTYQGLEQRIRTDTGGQAFRGTYLPIMDTVRGALLFLQQHPEMTNASATRVQADLVQLQTLQARVQDADLVKVFLRQRQMEIGSFLQQHPAFQGNLGSVYSGLNKRVYYYSQLVRQYKETLNDRAALEGKALAALQSLPVFQNFMKTHSQLGSLFSVPAGTAAATNIRGLQTKTEVSRQLQGQLGGVEPSASSPLQGKLQAAQAQLDDYKAKLSRLGSGNGDMAMPDFKPNDQHTKTFWNRLEYGTDLQTVHTNYYFPMVTDLGLSVGYRLGHENIAGVGASYKLGWGNGIQHVALSSQGVGLRSFVQLHIKGSFSATGGFEYNYTQPFTSFREIRAIQDWTKSGLIGMTKTISLKSHFFSKTTLSLLWDFLSYEQVPKTQPILFRVGYQWH